MSHYDLFSQNFKRDPFKTFAKMQVDDPVHLHIAANGKRFWYITKYEDVMAVLKDGRFVKDTRNIQGRPPKSTSTSLHSQINDNMLFSDPPDHSRLRALVNQAFTPSRAEKMRAQVQAVTDKLLDEMAQKGQIDLMADFALPLPVIVICDLLGVPEADQAQVTDWSQVIISPNARGLTAGARRRKMRAFVEYLHGLFALREAEPEDDLITALVQAEESGDTLSRAELSSMVALLLVTGHETTVNLIGNGALALLQHPAELAKLGNDEKKWLAAIEEILRFDGPVETSTTRWAGDDIVFRGQQILRGDVVRVSLASANRDPESFGCPHQFNTTRPAETKHLAFGHGIHYCLGAPLARLEGQVALQTLFTRFPQVDLAVGDDALQWRSGVLFRGLETLPVRLG